MWKGKIWQKSETLLWSWKSFPKYQLKGQTNWSILKKKVLLGNLLKNLLSSVDRKKYFHYSLQAIPFITSCQKFLSSWTYYKKCFSPLFVRNTLYHLFKETPFITHWKRHDLIFVHLISISQLKEEIALLVTRRIFQELTARGTLNHCTRVSPQLQATIWPWIVMFIFRCLMEFEFIPYSEFVS